MMLSTDLLLAFSVFALVTSITPGPNNTMLLASGMVFGFRRTFPHLLGVTGGFFLMVLGIGLGLGALFARVPDLYEWLRYLGAAYLIYLAWRVAQSSPTARHDLVEGAGRPIGFLNAAAFQWVNPKAWSMAVAAVSTYTPQQGYLVNVFIISALFAVINLPCVSLWAGCGSLIGRLLNDSRRQRQFNRVMALLLLASLYPMLA
ncbi:LysE family translocator [Allopusillimonas soli]|uniref:LysE family translocator n=1 Tax=Allopusillimonas soli TaxID=659016 RepID=A0A853F9H8_9BURK|nr:LysE family translocator [Allopusillimonas soli]NYT37345.1 LysE family translocator [Allopusillimonas soli]TEA74671.1 LysE family translocator [Allopusillimonas soli]